jgi:hypothetical protein
MAAFSAPKYGEALFNVMMLFEFAFLFDMCLNFLKSYTKDGETIPTRDLNQIAMRYLKT